MFVWSPRTPWSASRIAVRFADGRLKERMPVRGEDDMARLAMSFNDMAESLSKQITHLEEFGGLLGLSLPWGPALGWLGRTF